jgi:hypothetical protein
MFNYLLCGIDDSIAGSTDVSGMSQRGIVGGKYGFQYVKIVVNGILALIPLRRRCEIDI